jgi:hypothetical protein
VESQGDRAKYFVLVYDTRTMRVLSLTGHEHDYVGAVLALTRLLQEHRRRPVVRVRLLAAASLPDLLRRHHELFGHLTLPGE